MMNRNNKEKAFIYAGWTCLTLILFCAFGCASLSVLARLGVNTEWYCTHLSTKEDTFCIVRGLNK